MTVDYDKLASLDYTAFDHVKDFEEDLDDIGLRHPSVSVSGDYDEGVPVVEVIAHDSVTTEKYSKSYRLEDVTEEEFEEVIYDVWSSAFEEIEP